MSNSLSMYGNDVVWRPNKLDRGARKSFVDVNSRLESGLLSRYHLYISAADVPGSDADLSSPGMTRIQIWRPAAGSQSTTYTLVWQRRVFFNTSRRALLYTVVVIPVSYTHLTLPTIYSV